MLLVAAVVGLSAAGCGSTVPYSQSGSSRDGGGTGLVAPSAGSASAGTTAGLSTAQGETQARAPSNGGPRSGALGETTGASGNPFPTDSAPTVASIPRTGRGWDATTVYLGVGIETDASQAGHNAGYQSLDFGDMKGMAQAVLDHVNQQGGLYGRRLVPVYYDASTAQALSNPAQVSEQACTKWTQDRPVAAILITTPVLVTDELITCAAKRDTPVLAHSEVTFTEADYRKYQPYLTLTDNISHDRLVNPWVARLSALGYFQGWQTSAGRAGTAPVRVGIVYQSTPAADHGTALLVAALKARHVQVPDVLATSGITDTTSVQSAIVRFRRDGVTHVFLDFAASVTFPTAAEQQAYRPRYAVNSQDEIAAFLEANSPPAQLHGALGVGWMPPSDVDTNQDPRASPGAAACVALMRKAKVALTPRQAYFQAMVTCDQGLLFASAAARGGGFSTSSLRQGILAAAPTFAYATTFGGRTDQSSAPDKVGVVRDLGYVDACGCFRFLSDRPHVV